MRKSIWGLFHVDRSLSPDFIIYLLFRSLTILNGVLLVGVDTRMVLSIVLPVFLLPVEYVIYSSKDH